MRRPSVLLVDGRCTALAACQAMLWRRDRDICGLSIPKSLPASVCDHDKLNLDRVLANPRVLGHHHCKPGQHKTSNHLMREAAGMHQSLGDAARNPGKPLQGMAFVGCHSLTSPSEPIKEKITRIWAADYREHVGEN
jgi:hypothetical protein